MWGNIRDGPYRPFANVRQWEWETYRPGPEVYEQLWHIRKAPAIVTPLLPSDCPIPNAQTKILDRRQTEHDIKRNFYIVQITRPPTRDSTNTHNGEDTPVDEVEEVDLSRILHYVSPRELERFENEQFRIEAEAEAEALRQDAQDLARRRLAKNAKMPEVSKACPLLEGLRLDPNAPTRGKPKGKPRGRPRGRGRGRGRGSWRGRGALVMHSQLRDDEPRTKLVDPEGMKASYYDEEELQRLIAETETDEERSDEDRQASTSPNIMRSAFFTNSALPASPTGKRRRLSNFSMLQRARPEVPDPDGSDNELGDNNVQSISTATLPSAFEGDSQGHVFEESDEDIVAGHRHRSKRLRTESTPSDQRLTATRTKLSPALEHTASTMPPLIHPSSSHDSEEDGGIEGFPDESKAEHLYPASNRAPYEEDHESTSFDTAQTQRQSSSPRTTLRQHYSLSEENEETEEYAVEAILEHFHKGGKKHYLIKWEGYEDAYDWLPEDDLEGAAELVAEYHERIESEKGKGKGRQM